MAKNLIIRGRVNEVLKERLARYIEQENSKGRSIDESSVLRDATVEYLDARNVPVPAPSGPPRPANLESGDAPSPEAEQVILAAADAVQAGVVPAKPKTVAKPKAVIYRRPSRKKPVSRQST